MSAAASTMSNDLVTNSMVTQRPFTFRAGPYQLRTAVSESDRLAAFRLRFLVFNLELKEGLEESYATGQDSDEFDLICDHLIVEHVTSGKIVGTYRLQTRSMAATNSGFYCEREFDFSPYK